MRIVKNALCNSIIHESARYNRIKSSVFDKLLNSGGTVLNES